MVHQFVFGFEWLTLPRTVVPVAHVVTLLRATDVFHGDVRNQLVHGAESLATTFLAVRVLVWVDPFTDELLLDALTHVTEKRARVMMWRHVHAHVQAHGPVLVVVLGPGIGHLVVLISPTEHFAQPKPTVQHVWRAVVRSVLVMDPWEE